MSVWGIERYMSGIVVLGELKLVFWCVEYFAIGVVMHRVLHLWYLVLFLISSRCCYDVLEVIV